MYPSIQRRIAIREEYDEVRKSIRSKATEWKKLQKEKKELSAIHVKRHMELASAIVGLTEEIEELRSQKKQLLDRARCEDDEDMKSFAEKLDQAKRDYDVCYPFAFGSHDRIYLGRLDQFTSICFCCSDYSWLLDA